MRLIKVKEMFFLFITTVQMIQLQAARLSVETLEMDHKNWFWRIVNVPIFIIFAPYDAKPFFFFITENISVVYQFLTSSSKY